jgi:hypothetical protein
MSYKQYIPGGIKEPSRFAESIPYPNLQSWMHLRSGIPKETIGERNTRYANRFHNMLALDYLISGLARFFHIGNQTIRWAFYRVCMGLLRFQFRILNQIEIRGDDYIPPKGGIFYLNHFGKKDVAIFQAVFGKPLSAFVDSGNGLIADILEKYFYFVLRRGDTNVLIEKMVQTLLLKNRYFATWPEGTVSDDEQVLEAFSGIIKVYATINAKRDIIPFIPVYMQGTNCYFWHGRRRLKKIYVTYLKPFFLPRDWLKSPTEGGKSPREIANHIMMVLARANGQKELGHNHMLNWRRQNVETTWWQGGKRRKAKRPNNI